MAYQLLTPDYDILRGMEKMKQIMYGVTDFARMLK